MTGTLVNAGAIAAGSVIGLCAGRLITEGIRKILMDALGLAVMIIGIKMAVSAQNLIPMVACLILGGITGELMHIEDGVAWIGQRLKDRFASGSSTFVQGFMSATILYLTGAMTIIGTIQDGTIGDASVLYLKSLLDGVASIALTSTLGIGVAFSALSVLVVQGALTLMASHLAFLRVHRGHDHPGHRHQSPGAEGHPRGQSRAGAGLCSDVRHVSLGRQGICSPCLYVRVCV